MDRRPKKDRKVLFSLWCWRKCREERGEAWEQADNRAVENPDGGTWMKGSEVGGGGFEGSTVEEDKDDQRGKWGVELRDDHLPLSPFTGFARLHTQFWRLG